MDLEEASYAEAVMLLLGQLEGMYPTLEAGHVYGVDVLKQVVDTAGAPLCLGLTETLDLFSLGHNFVIGLNLGSEGINSVLNAAELDLLGQNEVFLLKDGL